MASPTPNHPPTPVDTGTDVTIDGPTDLGAKIVKHLAEKHTSTEEELWKLDAGKLKVTRSDKRSSLPEDLKFVWGATFVRMGFTEDSVAFADILDSVLFIRPLSLCPALVTGLAVSRLFVSHLTHALTHSPSARHAPAQTDHMLVIHHDPARGWLEPEIKPYGPLALDPASACLHYAPA